MRQQNCCYRTDFGQLAMALKKAGIIESKEGKSGGYNLAAGWEQKSLYDVMEALGK